MAARTIAIRITLDNRDALNATKAQILLTREMNKEVDKHTHLQNGLTNSFIKGNLAARGISVAYGLIKDSISAVIGSSIQFEHTLAKISAISEGSTLGMKTLERSILALSLATNQNQGEVAKAALEMGKMGLTSTQVAVALEGVVKLSRALDENLVQTGETVVGILNAYNFNVGEAERVTNQLAYTVKISALDMEKFGVAFSYVGGTASAAGVSFEELQASMDVLSNAGVRASTMGTSLRRIISDLSDENSKASLVAGGTIQSYGGLVNTLDALRQKNIDIAGLTEIFGRTASSTSAIVIKYAWAIADLAKKTAAVGDIVGPMSDTMNGTFKSAVDGVSTSWTNLGIEIGKSTGALALFLRLTEKALDAQARGVAAANKEAGFKAANPVEFRKALEEKVANKSFWEKVYEGQVGAEGVNNSESIFKTKVGKAFSFKQAVEEDKAKSSEMLLASLGSQKLPAKWGGTKEEFSKINPEDTAMFNYVQRLWGTDESGFQQVLQEARLAWALKAEKAQEEPPDISKLLNSKTKKKPLSLVKANAISDDEIKSFAAGLAAEDPNIGAAKTQDFTKGAKEAFEDKQKYQALADKIIKNAGRYGKRDKLGDESNEKLEILKEEQSQELALLTEHGINVAEVRKAQERELSDYIIQLHRQERESKLAISADFVGSMGQLMTQLAGKNRALAIAGKALASGEVILNTAVAVSKVWGQTGIFGFAAQAAPILSGAAQLAAINAIHFASGTDQVVTKPTMFMAGESGKERVTVTPRAKMASDRSGGGITVNIQGDVLDGAKFTEAVEMAQKRLRRRLV